MTPQEKANELGNKFYQGSVFDYDKQGHLDEIVRAKNRALIAVHELINVTRYKYHIDYAYNDFETVEYWQEVKQEILKL